VSAAGSPTAAAVSPRSPGSGQVWDGHALLAAFAAATDWLAANKDRVNALNVFPVPDGDTGTNMTLTMRAALDEAREAPSSLLSSAGEVAAKVAYGALMGARGNSGVILSQIFRGFAQGIAGRDEIDGRDLANALAGARDMAYKAVMRPVEGTMLTVIRVAAERAEAIAARTPALLTVLAEANRGAAEALEETPKLLDLLRQAGVVDAGGQGVVHILDGIERWARGDLTAAALPHPEGTRAGGLGAEMAFLDQVGEFHGEDAFGYCTNFMVFGDGIDFETARATLAAMGESAVIVGDERILKVHIHALNPGKVLDYALGLGELGQIKIDNMSAQTRALTDERRASRPEPPSQTAPAVPTIAPQPIGRQAVLAVAPGEGLAEALRSMGAADVIRGGQTDNPSTEELLDAVEAAAGDDVILLPNNPNILLAANQVPGLTEKRVRVVPTRSVPQALAALEAFNADAGLDENARRMEEALGAVRTVELTRAVRDATVNGVAVAAGQVIGLLDDKLVAAGDDEGAVFRDALDCADLEAVELVTIFLGEDAGPDEAGHLEAVVVAACPEAEVQVLPGGQPHYRFVVGIQ
jgi:DAK2 domain fusion protein YloV